MQGGRVVRPCFGLRGDAFDAVVYFDGGGIFIEEDGGAAAEGFYIDFVWREVGGDPWGFFCFGT